VLYALYGLLELERVDALLEADRDVHNAFLMNHALHPQGRSLEKDRAAVRRAMETGPLMDDKALDPIVALNRFEAGMRAASGGRPKNRKVS
jgi:hypothetical protein